MGQPPAFVQICMIVQPIGVVVSIDTRAPIYFADFFVNAVISGMPAARAASTIATTVP
jgi:hypothetical protein